MYSTHNSCQVLMDLQFSRQISERKSDIKYLKILSVRAELFHAERRADMTKLIFAYSQFLLNALTIRPM